MFPRVIGNIIKYTPIYSVSYGPAKLILNFSSSIFKNILLAQIITIVIVTILLIIIYKKGVKKLNVNGG
jgi:ABC-2 type transport system permease protein